MNYEQHLDRFNELVEALAGLTPDFKINPTPSKLLIQTSAGVVSIYSGFAHWLRERPELIDGVAMRDLLSNPIRERVRLFKTFAAYQVAFEEFNNVTR